MDKQRLLITGASGLLGSNLACYFRDKYEIMGLYHSHPYNPAGVRVQAVDLTETAEIGRIMREFRPDFCIHCAALADIDFCEQQRDAAYRMNAILPQRIAEATAAAGVYLVHISTDNVFDGRKGNYTECDPVGPLSYYSETKLAAEKALASFPRTLVIRTSFYGNGGGLKKSLVEWALGELAAGHQINGFTDAITSNIFVLDLARIIDAAVDRRLTGVYHAACSDARSKYDLLRDVAVRSGFDPARVFPSSLDNFKAKAPRPKNISLNVSKLADCLGRDLFPSSVESVEHFFADRRKAQAQP